MFDPGTKVVGIFEPAGFDFAMGGLMDEGRSIPAHEEFRVVFGGRLQEIDAASPGCVSILGISANGEGFTTDPSEPPADAGILAGVGGL